jgi:uncharacterized protein YjeT (DUF2065 family)
MRVSKTATVRTILLAISALMIWEALFPTAFTSVFKRPIRDFVELSYLAAMLGSIVFVGIAVYQLIRRRGPIEGPVLNLTFTVSWCLVLAVCFILMGVRTGL